MRLKVLIILRYAKNFSLPLLLFIFLYISNSFNIFYSNWIIQVCYYSFLILCVIGFGVFSYRNSESKSILFSCMVANGIVYMVAYSTLRSIIGTSQIENYFFAKYGLSDTSLHFFKTIFSIGYGMFQFFSGYLIGKFGNKVIGLFGIISSICILLTNSNLIPNIEILMLIRFINGIAVSCGVLCIVYQLRALKVSVNKYSVIFSLSNMFVSSISAVTMNQLSVYVNPHIALNVMSFMFLIPSLIFFINGFTYKELKDNSQIYDDSINYLDVIKNGLCNSKYNLMLLQSILIVIAGCTLRDSCLLSICEICSLDNALILKSKMKYLLEIGFIYGYLFILYFLKNDRYRRMMIIFGIMNFVSSLVLFCHNYVSMHVYIVYISVFAIGMSVKGHLIPQIMAGSSEKDNRLSAGLVGFLNAGVMLFALPFCQQIMPTFSLKVSTLMFVLFSSICTLLSLIDYRRNKN